MDKTNIISSLEIVEINDHTCLRIQVDVQCRTEHGTHVLVSLYYFVMEASLYYFVMEARERMEMMRQGGMS